MTLNISPIPAFTDNYIWIFYGDSGDACVVDPGDSAPVHRFLTENQLRLTTILITHHHPDHTGGVLKLKESTGATVVGPVSMKIEGIDRAVTEGETVEVLGVEFSVLEVPGHTLDHIAFYAQSERVLFCGDTLFAMGCGRLFEGDPEMMFRSLAKLSALPADTAVYCTHEYTQANQRFALAAEPENPQLIERAREVDELRDQARPTLPSTIARELATNPFLRCNKPAIQSRVSRQFEAELSNPVEVFAQLRRWKDNF